MENIKLIDNSNKYITNNDDNKISIKSKQFGLNQKFSYNAQGELVSNNKCMTSKNDSVYFDDCNNNDSQKWKIDDGKIYSEENVDKCLESVDGNAVLKNCDNSEFQQWNKENDNDNTTNYFSWQKFKGKNVVLVESDNPWYLNKENSHELKYQPHVIINDDYVYRDNSDVKFKSILDSTKPDLGKGYSYASRLYKNNIENFNAESDNTNTSLIVIILVALIFLMYIFKKN